MASVSALVLGASLTFATDAVPASRTKVNPITISTPRTAKIRQKKTETRKKGTQIGSASWYGKSFQGRPTASGEAYDMYQFTAASRSLPLGSWVKVTNLRNGKWLIVKVNDRGPYVGNRIMDVSYGAAQMLGFKSRGVEKVKLEVVHPEMLAKAGSTWPLD